MNNHGALDRDTVAPRITPDLAAMKKVWIDGRRIIDVPCTVEIEQTSDSLFANVALEGVEADYGDEVRVHEAPSRIPFGQHSITRSRATVIKAGSLERLRTRLLSYLELTELYEVGFQPKE